METRYYSLPFCEYNNKKISQVKEEEEEAFLSRAAAGRRRCATGTRRDRWCSLICFRQKGERRMKYNTTSLIKKCIQNSIRSTAVGYISGKKK